MIEAIASALGLRTFTVGVVLGLVLGAAPAGWGGYKIGHMLGYGAGAAAANKEAEINDLTRKLAEAKRDRLAAEDRAAAAREQAEQNARAMLSAQGDLDEYRAELERLAAASNAPDPDSPPAPECPTRVVDLRCRAAGPVDVRRLQSNHWRPIDQADSPVAPVRK